jgi:putative chitinase
VKLTLEQTKQLIEGNREFEEWHGLFQKYLPKYEIDTPNRMAMFFAQCGHESLNFRVLEENLNYSAKGLNAVFPKYFQRAGRDATLFARNPRAIANVVYANRMGNGDSHSDDGWLFRGKGAIQLTGRNNTTAFANAIGRSVERTLEYLFTKEGALEAACWFWKANGLNDLSDDIKKATRKINGGTIGIADRTHHYHRALEILGGTYTMKPSPILLKVGSTGDRVKQIQEKLGEDADGIFGLVTKQAVEKWQAANGLIADGIVGPKTFAAMIG